MTQFLGHFCHSTNATQGGWPFPWPMLEQASSMQVVTPVVATTNARSLHFADRPFSLQTPHVPLWYSPPPFYPWQYMLKHWGWIKDDSKNSHCKSWLMFDILAKLRTSQASAMATDTWCIRSHWKELQICFLDLFEGVGYTESAAVFTNGSLALNGIPQLARIPVNTLLFNIEYHGRYLGFHNHAVTFNRQWLELLI